MNQPPDISTASRQTTFREFFTVVFRRRWIILGLFLATTATVTTLVLSTRTTWISSGRVLLKRGEVTNALQPDRRIYSDWEQELGSEIELAKSEPVLESARRILAAEPLPDGRFAEIDAKALDVEVMGKSNVLAIGYVDDDPKIARKVCDAAIRAYVDFRQTQLGMISYPKGFFESELADVSRQLERALERRSHYTSGARVADVDEERRGLVSEIGLLRMSESELNARLAEATSNVRVMRELSTRPDIQSPLIDPAGNEALVDLRRRIVEQEARVALLLERYRDESPEVTNARQTLASLKALLAREIESRIQVAESRVEVVKSQLEAVRGDLDHRQRELASMPDKQVALGELDRAIEVLRRRYAALVETSDRARVMQNTTSHLTVLVLDRPGPAVPANARDWVRIALAPAFSLLVGIGIAFFVDGLDVTVRTAGQAEEAARIPVLASISERRRRRA